MRPDNILPLLAVARDNFSLEEYLVGQVLQTKSHRFKALREFYPNVDEKRLGVRHRRPARSRSSRRIKRRTGTLEFGTEIVSLGRLPRSSALLGASPGASTAVWIMVHMLENCFHEQLVGHRVPKIKEMIPSYGGDLKTDAALVERVRKDTAEVLGLTYGSMIIRLGAPRPCIFTMERDAAPRSGASEDHECPRRFTLDVVLRFGAAMLRSGDTAFRVRDAMGLWPSALGIEHLAVHITIGGMTATAQAGGETVTLTREIAPLGVDASRIASSSSGWRGSSKPGLRPRRWRPRSTPSRQRPRCIPCCRSRSRWRSPRPASRTSTAATCWRPGRPPSAAAWARPRAPCCRARASTSTP